MLIHQWVLIHVLFVLTGLAGVGLAFARCFNKTSIPSAYNVRQPSTNEERFVYLVTRVGWPPLLWLQNVVAAMGPISYMLFPPATPVREDLMCRDGKTTIAYPKVEVRRPRTSLWIGWRFGIVAIAFVYNVALIVTSPPLLGGQLK